MQRHSAVVLGASGLVAQRMQQRLANHPWFQLSAVLGSQRTAGRTLDSIDWKLSEKKPDGCSRTNFLSRRILFTIV